MTDIMIVILIIVGFAVSFSAGYRIGHAMKYDEFVDKYCQCRAYNKYLEERDKNERP